MSETVGIASVGIIGAGAKGGEIAAYALVGGYRVILEDVSSVRLAAATALIDANVGSALARKRIDANRRREIEANFFTAQSIDEVSRAADLLIEAAPEDAELQLEIFTIFDKFAKPHAIFVSTALSISIADLASMTNCRERCVGLQFPAPGTPDRELRIIRAPKTSARTVQMCANFARTIGLAPRTENELPNELAVTQEAQTS